MRRASRRRNYLRTLSRLEKRRQIIVAANRTTKQSLHMLQPLLFLLMIVLMAPAIYVLFFTTVVDRLLLRLRLGSKEKTITDTAQAFNRSVKATADDLRDDREHLDRALRTVEQIAERSKPRNSRTPEEYPWLIRGEVDQTAYWSNEFGWVDLHDADRFDNAEKLTLTLPIGGRWYKPRKKSTLTTKGQ